MKDYKSIIDNGTRCFMCGTTHNLTSHHLLPGTADRKKCDEDKLIITLCFTHHRQLHDNSKMLNEYRKLGQKYYELKIGTREQWLKRYKKNYL